MPDDHIRLTTVQEGVLDPVGYQWDANGNLLDDGESAYTYNHANRLISVSSPPSSVSFTYNGLGDRMQQTVDSETTTYTLDMARGLTQVLADGENTYLYGVGRIGEYASANWAYHHADALGSLRQLTDSEGAVTLSRSYQPYGEELSSSGVGASSYGFTGEITDSTGMVYLRARYYSPWDGRFAQRDPWPGNIYRPETLNYGYVYVRNNPILFADPSGMTDCGGWPGYVRWMCEKADDGNLATINLLYNLIAVYSDLKGGDFDLASVMLKHGLNEKGEDPLNLSFEWGERFGNDPNIADAANLLFTEFIKNDVENNTDSNPIRSSYAGLDYYSWDNRPKPKSDGLYGGTGHVAVNGDFSADLIAISGGCRYMVRYTADYSVYVGLSLTQAEKPG